jgi:hypothetical protein
MRMFNNKSIYTCKMCYMREEAIMAKRGLYANIHAKKKRIAAGSGEKMRKPGSKGAPTKANFIRSAKTAKKPKKKK